jgi:hypothetical protein
VICIASLFFVGLGTSFAGTLLFDRGLPTDNLNNAAGSNRSNVAWGFGTDPDGHWLAGDDFSIGGSGNYLVDTITVWSTSANASLWLGPEGGTFQNFSPSATTSVLYSDSTTYQKSGGSFTTLYQYDFSINEVLSGATTYQFFLDGLVPSFIHSSNAALSDSTQQGSDNLMLGAFVANGSGAVTDVEAWDSNAPGVWDKSSDANIQVYGTKVPEPSLMLLLSIGLGAVSLGSWRKRK